MLAGGFVCVRRALGEDPFRGLLEVKALCNGGASGEWSRPSRESDDQQVVGMEARGSFPEIAVAKDKKTKRLTKDEKSVLAGVEESGREWYREGLIDDNRRDERQVTKGCRPYQITSTALTKR